VARVQRAKNWSAHDFAAAGIDFQSATMRDEAQASSRGVRPDAEHPPANGIPCLVRDAVAKLGEEAIGAGVLVETGSGSRTRWAGESVCRSVRNGCTGRIPVPYQMTSSA
jgi:hypothetical protein